MTDVLGLDDAAAWSPLYSPLWLVTQEPGLNEFVAYLGGTLNRLREAPSGAQELVFSRSRLAGVRRAFGDMILRGEAKLHRLCDLLCRHLLTADPSWKLSSVAVGEVDATRERFVLTQALTADEVFATSDLDLGSRQLQKLRFVSDGQWSPASLVANFVEYQPTEPNIWRIHKIISRIKAEEEIWNKVADEIFDLDGLVSRDKQISHLSPFVKDVFGLKFVVDGADDVGLLHDELFRLRWSPAWLAANGAGSERDATALELIEHKDYLGSEGSKASGWRAYKSVVRWSGKTVEVQIQPLRTYLHEQEYLTRESHAGFKARRERIREEVAAREPLYGFCQALLKWLFMGPPLLRTAPHYPGLTLRLEE